MSDSSNIDKVLILLVGDSKEFLYRAAHSPFYRDIYTVTKRKWRIEADSTCVDVVIDNKEIELTIQIYNSKFLEKLKNLECESPSAVVYVLNPNFKDEIKNVEKHWVKNVDELFPNVIKVVLKCEDYNDVIDEEELKKFAEKIGTSYYKLDPYSFAKPFDDFYANIVINIFKKRKNPEAKIIWPIIKTNVDFLTGKEIDESKEELQPKLEEEPKTNEQNEEEKDKIEEELKIIEQNEEEKDKIEEDLKIIEQNEEEKDKSEEELKKTEQNEEKKDKSEEELKITEQNEEENNKSEEELKKTEQNEEENNKSEEELKKIEQNEGQNNKIEQEQKNPEQNEGQKDKSNEEKNDKSKEEQKVNGKNEEKNNKSGSTEENGEKADGKKCCLVY